MSFIDRIRGSVQPYFFRLRFDDGEMGYVYLLCKSSLQKDLYISMRGNVIPPYAVVIAMGKGEPEEKTRFDMERFYGFSHEDQSESA